MRNNYTKKYYQTIILRKKSLILKRIFDILASFLLLFFLLPLILLISIIIKLDSEGPIIYKQRRVTQYRKEFLIFKFRTMRENSGSKISYKNDSRVTKVGKILRKFKLDEIPQLVNVLFGEMTFVGTRPEVPEYVQKYNKKMLSTLILPAGITSIASIKFRDEEKYFNDSSNVESIYLNCVLPNKMIYNIEYLRKFSFLFDIKILFLTFLKILGILR